MKSISVRFCKCGRIHFVDEDVISEALEKDKNVLLICGGCGKATIIGADKETDWDDPSITNYMMYATPLIPNGSEDPFMFDASFFKSTPKVRKGYHKVIIDPGKRVPMMTGYYATSFDGRLFFDMQYPDFWKLKKTATKEEILAFIDEYFKNQKTVDMHSLIRSLKPEEAEVLSHCLVSCFNWKGTKWETDYNSSKDSAEEN